MIPVEDLSMSSLIENAVEYLSNSSCKNSPVEEKHL